MIVGLTGGIGSGKSTVAKYFQEYGIPVFDADTEAKALLDEDADLQSSLVDVLGSDILVDGLIDKPKMASIIFSDEEVLQEVNGLVHPAVGRAFQEWYKKQQAPYVIREAAILYESGSYKDCAAVIAVRAPEQLRIERVMKRNGISEAQVRQRMARQWPEEEKTKRADYVITNEHLEDLMPQIHRIHEDLLRRANS